MKKMLLVLCVLVNVAFANNVTQVIKSNDENPKVSVIPQELLSLLVDNGIKQTEIKPGIYEAQMNNLRCDSLRKDAHFPDSSEGGLTFIKCFKDAEIERNGKGDLLIEGRMLAQVLNSVESNTGMPIWDCSMGGRCTAFVSEIKCSADLNQDSLSDAFMCELK